MIGCISEIVIQLGADEKMKNKTEKSDATDVK